MRRDPKPKRRLKSAQRRLTPAQKGILCIFLASMLGAHVKLEFSDDAQNEIVWESTSQAEIRR